MTDYIVRSDLSLDMMVEKIEKLLKKISTLSTILV